MATRTQILETSLQLFLEKGCKNVTMDDIASENGMSKRTLYELFKDKSSLLEESIVTLHERKMEVINQKLFSIFCRHSCYRIRAVQIKIFV